MYYEVMEIIDRQFLEKQFERICKDIECSYDDGCLFLDESGVWLKFEGNEIEVTTPYYSFRFKISMKDEKIN